jgi:hypothetical protein
MQSQIGFNLKKWAQTESNYPFPRDVQMGKGFMQPVASGPCAGASKQIENRIKHTDKDYTN